MLRFDETRDNRGRLGVGVVVRDRRPAPLSGGDDAEPDVRERRDGAGRPADCDGRRSVQDHEGGRVAAHRVRAVLGEVGEGDQVDSAADAGGTS